ncbi:MAG TPA: hypothetical protein VI588_03075 [Candidatus Gracilibacteria bacterium]|nr:hypothetical protein [Candidatus Gracilibacteria bacterium]
MPPGLNKVRTVDEADLTDDFSDFSNGDVRKLSEVDTIVGRLAELHTNKAVEILSCWRFYCHGDVESLRELTALIVGLIEKHGVEKVYAFVFFGSGTWQRLSFFQLKLVVTVAHVSMDEATRLVRLFIENSPDQQKSEFFFKTGAVHGFSRVRDLAMITRSVAYKEKLFDAAFELLQDGPIDLAEFFLVVCSQDHCEDSDIADIASTVRDLLLKKQHDRCRLFLARCIHRFDWPRPKPVH